MSINLLVGLDRPGALVASYSHKLRTAPISECKRHTLLFTTKRLVSNYLNALGSIEFIRCARSKSLFSWLKLRKIALKAKARLARVTQVLISWLNKSPTLFAGR